MRILVRIALVALLSFAGSSQAAAQRATMGATVRLGSADSLYRAFVVHVKAGEYTLQRADSAQRQVTFLSPQLTKEVLRVRFTQRGDSTEIAAAGVDGGIVATIAGLSAVQDFLTALDSTRTARKPR